MREESLAAVVIADLVDISERVASESAPMMLQIFSAFFQALKLSFQSLVDTAVFHINVIVQDSWKMMPSLKARISFKDHSRTTS